MGKIKTHKHKQVRKRVRRTRKTMLKKVRKMKKAKRTRRRMLGGSSAEYARLKKKLTNGTNLNHQDDLGRTLLHIAVETKQEIPVITQLLNDMKKEGVDVNTKDNDEFTALNYATKYNQDINVIKELLDAGADVNSKDYDNNNVLHNAVIENANIDVLNLLLEKVDDIDDIKKVLKVTVQRIKKFNFYHNLLKKCGNKCVDKNILHGALELAYFTEDPNYEGEISKMVRELLKNADDSVNDFKSDDTYIGETYRLFVNS